MSRAALLVLSAVVAASCGRCGEAPVPRALPEVPASAKNVRRAIHRPTGKPPTQLLASHARYGFSLYWLGAPPKSPAEELKALAKKEAPLFTLPRAHTDNVEGAALVVTDSPAVAEGVEHLAPVLSESDRQALATAQVVTRVQVATDAAHAWRALKAVHSLLEKLARRHPAVVVDETTREVFSVEAFVARRLAPWSAEKPPVATQVVVRGAPQPGEGVRLATLGLQKLLLPDLVLEHVPPADVAGATTLLMALAQRALEAPETMSQTGALRLPAYGSARADVEFTLLLAEPSEGDADNRLVTPDVSGEGLFEERLAAALRQAFGK